MSNSDWRECHCSQAHGWDWFLCTAAEKKQRFILDLKRKKKKTEAVTEPTLTANFSEVVLFLLMRCEIAGTQW